MVVCVFGRVLVCVFGRVLVCSPSFSLIPLLFFFLDVYDMLDGLVVHYVCIPQGNELGINNQP